MAQGNRMGKNTNTLNTGQGRRRGKGTGGGRRGGGGPGGDCVCPQCDRTMPHQRGVPCTEMICPECGTPMFRKR